MGAFERKYRDGVIAYVLSLTPAGKKEFAYHLWSAVSCHKRQLRDLKEQLAEEVAALAFVESELYVIPFKKPELPAAPKESVGIREDVSQDPKSDRVHNVKRKTG